MIHIFRQNQRILMLVIAVLTIIAFIWLYNPAQTDKLGTNKVATIYGRNLAQADLDREARSFRLALTLGQYDLVQTLGGLASNQDQALMEYIWNVLVLQHQAAALGIEPDDQQVKERLESLEIFQTSGQFDPRKYGQFLQEQLGPLGFTQRQLESIIRDSLRLEALTKVVGAPVAVSDAELREAFRLYQKVDLQRLSFPLALATEGVQVTDEEIKGFFERNQASLISPETRAVQYVEFALPAAAEGQDQRQRVEAMQKAADEASVFAEKAAASTFEKAAADAGLTVQTTAEFDRSGASATAPAAESSMLSGIAPAAFLLTEDRPVSDVLQAGDHFYVLKLGKTTPARALTVEEVRPQIVERLTAAKAERALQTLAETKLAAIRASLAAGKPFAEAVLEAGVTAEPISSFNPSVSDLRPEQQLLAAMTLMMEPGQLSGFRPTPNGGFAVYLDSREPLDEAEFAKQKPRLENGLLESKQQVLFLTWLTSAREAAKITFVQRGEP